MLNFGWREGLSKREAETLFAEGRDLARKCDDAAREAMLHTSYGRVLGTIESADQYLRHALEGVRIAREVSNPALEFLARCGTSQALRHAGRLPEALSLIEELMQQAAPDPDMKVHRLGFSPYLWLLGLRGETLAWMGRLGEASRDIESLTEAAAAGQQVVLIDQAHKAWVEIHWIRGDAGPALREAAEAVQTAERRASPYAIAMAYAALGLAQLMSRRPSEAASATERALATARERRVGLEFEASMLAQLAEARLQAGHLVRARETAELAGKEARARHARVLECQASLVLARVLLKTRGRWATDAAASALAHSLTLVDETGARALEPFVHIELAELARLRADAATRDAELHSARDLLEAMGASTRAAALL
jgi:adenylate cyclase